MRKLHCSIDQPVGRQLRARDDLIKRAESGSLLQSQANRDNVPEAEVQSGVYISTAGETGNLQIEYCDAVNT